MSLRENLALMVKREELDQQENKVYKANLDPRDPRGLKERL